MVDSTLKTPALEESPRLREQLRLLILGTAALTLFLMALGSATRVMDAGLACPDWPLCYGTVLPRAQMNLQVFLEWFHRLVASCVGMTVVTLTALSWWKRVALPRWLPWAMTGALALVVLQGVLGGLTVTELLRFDIVTAHLGTGLLFFTVLVATGLGLTPYQGLGTADKLTGWSLTAALLVYGQSILGALVASRWAVHLCLGSGDLCQVMHNHLLGVVPASGSTLTLVVLAWRTPSLHPYLRHLRNLAAVLLGVQVSLGLATLYLRLQIAALTVAHQAVGALLLGTLVAFTVLCLRDSWWAATSPLTPKRP